MNAIVVVLVTLQWHLTTHSVVLRDRHTIHNLADVRALMTLTVIDSQ